MCFQKPSHGPTKCRFRNPLMNSRNTCIEKRNSCPRECGPSRKYVSTRCRSSGCVSITLQASRLPRSTSPANDDGFRLLPIACTTPELHRTIASIWQKFENGYEVAGTKPLLTKTAITFRAASVGSSRSPRMTTSGDSGGSYGACSPGT